jgi:hypothetical protein
MPSLVVVVMVVGRTAALVLESSTLVLEEKDATRVPSYWNDSSAITAKIDDDIVECTIVTILVFASLGSVRKVDFSLGNKVFEWVL